MDREMEREMDRILRENDWKLRDLKTGRWRDKDMEMESDKDR